MQQFQFQYIQMQVDALVQVLTQVDAQEGTCHSLLNISIHQPSTCLSSIPRVSDYALLET